VDSLAWNLQLEVCKEAFKTAEELRRAVLVDFAAPSEPSWRRAWSAELPGKNSSNAAESVHSWVPPGSVPSVKSIRPLFLRGVNITPTT
jgi:hypothetical protein